MNSQLRKELEQKRIEDAKKFGDKYVYSGKKEAEKLPFIASPSLMLDYKIGGGFRFKHAVEVFGAPAIGKSSAIAYGTMASAQKLDKGIVTLIAMEHRSADDFEWMRKFGLEPEDIDIKYPDHAEEAFGMLKEAMEQEYCFCVIDSLGAMGSQSEFEKGDLTKKAYGISGAVTTGLNSIMPKLWKKNNALMILNQQREKGRYQNGAIDFDSAGGQNLKHHMSLRIQIKPGEKKIMGQKDGKTVKIGQELICQIKKVTTAEAKDEAANFIWIYKETDEHKVGIDKVTDVVNTAKMVGVLRSGGAWLYHKSFPDEKLQGVDKVAVFLEANPKALENIRKDVLALV